MENDVTPEIVIEAARKRWPSMSWLMLCRVEIIESQPAEAWRLGFQPTGEIRETWFAQTLLELLVRIEASHE